MTLATIYAQLCRVVQADAEAIACDYAYPPKTMTTEETEEYNRLMDLADRLHAESVAMGHPGGWPFEEVTR